MKTLLLATTTLAALLGASSVAHAQCSHSEHAIELEASATAGGLFLGPARRVLGPSFGAGAWLGYRISSRWSVGLQGSGQAVLGGAFDRDAEASISAASGGVAARWRPLGAARVAPWFSAGLAVHVLMVHYAHGTSPGETSQRLSGFHVAVPVAVGLDVTLARGFAVTASAAASLALPVAACVASEFVGASNHTCDAIGAQGAFEEAGATWSASLGVRYSVAP